MLNYILRRLIIFFIRKLLHLKKYEHFQFENQKSKDNMYFFSETTLWKIDHDHGDTYPSNVSLSHLLSEDCSIKKCDT